MLRLTYIALYQPKRGHRFTISGFPQPCFLLFQTKVCFAPRNGRDAIVDDFVEFYDFLDSENDECSPAQNTLYTDSVAEWATVAFFTAITLLIMLYYKIKYETNIKCNY